MIQETVFSPSHCKDLVHCTDCTIMITALIMLVPAAMGCVESVYGNVSLGTCPVWITKQPQRAVDRLAFPLTSLPVG